MRSIANAAGMPCPNASWDGATTNFCAGVAADDIVGHEWAHAYTQLTHGLIYQWQPGALNESYSDIWGEVVDQLNGRGTDLPGSPRSAGVCSEHSLPLPVLRLNAPATIAGDCAAGASRLGPWLTTAGTTGVLVHAEDGVGGTDTSTTNGCRPITNHVAGKVALIDLGACTFATKIKNAQNAGAIAVVVGSVFNQLGIIGGNDPTITIPSLLISLDNRNLIVGQLEAGQTVNVTLRRQGGPPEDSYRWLQGEDATAFIPTAPTGGHALRDMWDPTCLSDPGKVTDAEYACATADAGGVHTNSGVPNHGFALLVDGGTYNGRTVAGIGLTKAAHLYWRAQTIYQTPLSGFADHADALEASCRDLIGASLNVLSATAPAGPSGQAITPADCAQVTHMAAAVELRTSPAEQCNHRPLLSPGSPALCAGQENPPRIYSAGFEDGLEGWQVSNQGRYAGWPGTDWRTRSSLPGGRAGAAAFAADPDGGSCDQGPNDMSGLMQMTSPAITLPAAGFLSPRLTFEHYVATEIGYDGGNVKLSVNGGAFALVPASAFQFNAYNAQLLTAPGNTNPLAGESAFTGTDGGIVSGSWGLSQVDLTRIGVKPGDTIQVRFEMGIDGCTGVDGWYVDNVRIEACAVTATDSSPAATVLPTLSLTLGAPAAFGNFTPGVGREYSASTTANVISSAGDATLSVGDPSPVDTGKLVNGTFRLANPLVASATSAGGTPAAGGAVGGSSAPTNVLTYGGPVSNDSATLSFRQTIGANEALRTGAYSKALTFTLSTTTP
jgi:hypothetical protein